MSDLLSHEGSDIVHLSLPGDLWGHPCSRRNILLLSYDVLQCLAVSYNEAVLTSLSFLSIEHNSACFFIKFGYSSNVFTLLGNCSRIVQVYQSLTIKN